MKLKSFGCSFIYGDELRDATDASPSKLTWPALLSNHLGYEYECHAKNGSGNLQILDTLLSQLADKNNDTVYVINWTWPERYNYKNDTDWVTLQPNQSSSEAATYYRNFHNEYVDKLTLLMCMTTAVGVLGKAKANYIMTYMKDEHIKPSESEFNLIPLYHNLLQYLTFWDGHGFNSWCEINKFEKCPGRHWAESTQQQAFEYIKHQLVQKGL